MPRKRSKLHQLAFDQVPLLHAGGLTPRQMATELMVSLFTVHRWLDEHGLDRDTYTTYTAPTVREAVERIRAGASITATSMALKIPQATLSHWCDRAGVVSQHPKIGRPARSIPTTTDTTTCHAA
jgi:hypothetical protein